MVGGVVMVVCGMVGTVELLGATDVVVCCVVVVATSVVVVVSAGGWVVAGALVAAVVRGAVVTTPARVVGAPPAGAVVVVESPAGAEVEVDGAGPEVVVGRTVVVGATVVEDVPWLATCWRGDVSSPVATSKRRATSAIDARA